MFDKIKKLLGVKTESPQPEPQGEAPTKSKKTKQKKAELSAKELANKNNEPYIAITKIHVDPNDINNGAFELDWNDKFVLNLVKQGFKLKDSDTDNDIVDRWFQTVCRNVALEIYEQEMADPEKRSRTDVRVIQSKDLGNGRTEIS